MFGMMPARLTRLEVAWSSDAQTGCQFLGAWRPLDDPKRNAADGPKRIGPFGAWIGSSISQVAFRPKSAPPKALP